MREITKEGIRGYIKELLERNFTFEDIADEQITTVDADSLSRNVFYYLVERGFDINYKKDQGRNVLFYVYRYELIKELVEKGADPFMKDESGELPIIETVRDDNIKALNYFLSLGVDINSRDFCGRNLLSLATKTRKRDISRFLIEKGADIHSQDKWKNQAIHYAVSEQNIEILNLLIEKGADVNALNDRNRTPLNTAFSWGNSEIVSILEKAGGKYSRQLSQESIFDITEMI